MGLALVQLTFHWENISPNKGHIFLKGHILIQGNCSLDRDRPLGLMKSYGPDI